MWKSWREQVFSAYAHRDIRLWDIAVGIGIAFFFSYFFYRSLWVLPLMLTVGGGYVLSAGTERRRRRIRQEKEQFKECILSVSASMKAGYASSNAFLESIPDMVMLYGEESYIVEELRVLKTGLQNRETLEKLLSEWGERSGLEEILEFADVFSIGKRGGGNMQEIIDATCQVISHTQALEDELEALLANKRLEQSMMNVMPFAVVFYLEWGNKGYFDMLYEGYVGRIIMTGCLLAYLFAYWLSKRILHTVAKV